MSLIGISKTSVKEGKEYIGDRIERLLFTQKGEIPGNPDYGSYLEDFFHEPLDETSADDILNEINLMFEENEEDIGLEDIYVEILHSENGQAGILIKITAYDLTTQDDFSDSNTYEFFRYTEMR